jgi:hypothetical protein
MKTSSIRPFGFKGRSFERKRHAEAFVEQVIEDGGKASWKIWGKKFKVYYMEKTRY